MTRVFGRCHSIMSKFMAQASKPESKAKIRKEPAEPSWHSLRFQDAEDQHEKWQLSLRFVMQYDLFKLSFSLLFTFVLLVYVTRNATLMSLSLTYSKAISDYYNPTHHTLGEFFYTPPPARARVKQSKLKKPPPFPFSPYTHHSPEFGCPFILTHDS